MFVKISRKRMILILCLETEESIKKLHTLYSPVGQKNAGNT